MDWQFGPFRLDLKNMCLWQEEQQLTLRPKTFELLAYLVARDGDLVTRADLLEAVWPDAIVADGVLTTSIGELRQAFGESARAPQYIATVHRRGYRFIAPVTASSAADETPRRSVAAFPDDGVAPSRHLIEREAELQQLRHWFTAACQGRRQVVFLAGETGIGKTALLDAFLDQLDTAARPWVGRGQCIDHYGAGEAYLPLLEALGQVASQDRAGVTDVLRQHAPSWLLQLPGLSTPETWERLQQQSFGASRERMLRELAEAVEILTLERPLILALDDLHWSDVSTLDWLAYVARRRAPARLLVIGAYRPVDAVARQHPIRAVTQELRIHGQCEELLLAYWSVAGVTAYLQQAFGAASLPENAIQAFYQRTNGNPLFVVSVVSEAGASAPAAAQPETVLMRTPESLRLLIGRQLEHLLAGEREYLEAASVAGREFSPLAVAASLDMSEEEADAPYAELARRGQFILAQDGAAATRYRFIHDLYHEFLYEHIPASRRARWHQRVGTWLEAAYGSKARESAGEIAEHFVRGRAHDKALPYLQEATENALRRSAPQEAIRHAATAFECLRQLPQSDARDRRELSLQLNLAAAWAASNGFSFPAVEQAYARAQALAQQLGETAQLFAALYGLFVVHELRADFHDSAKYSDDLLQLAEAQQDRALLIGAHELKACALIHTGQFVEAQAHVNQGLKFYQPGDHHDLVALYGLDLGFYNFFWAAMTLWLCGYPDQSLQHTRQVLDLAQPGSHAFSAGCAYLFATHIHCLRGESLVVREHAEALIALATEHGFSDLLAQGTIMQGWALAQQGPPPSGMAEMERGLAGYRVSGQEMDRPFYLALLAQAYGLQQQPEKGLAVLDEALTMTASMQGYAYEAWLYQLQGDLLLAADRQRSTAGRAPEACFQLAIEIARRQQAKSLELRAAMSLSRWRRGQGEPRAAWRALKDVYETFTEGFDTADLQAAKRLLEAPI